MQSLQSVCPGMPPLTAILPWNNRELFGKGGKINTPSVDYPPAILGSFGSAMCSEHQRPVGDVGLKGGDAQFNQTFGCLCVRCHVPPFQRNDILRETMGRNHPLWSEEASNLCIMCPFPRFFFYKTQKSALRCVWLKCNQEHFLGALKRGKILSSISASQKNPWGELRRRSQEHIRILYYIILSIALILQSNMAQDLLSSVTQIQHVT